MRGFGLWSLGGLSTMEKDINAYKTVRLILQAIDNQGLESTLADLRSTALIKTDEEKVVEKEGTQEELWEGFLEIMSDTSDMLEQVYAKRKKKKKYGKKV